MTQKSLVLFGTRHWKKDDIPEENRAAINFILQAVSPAVVLEEWRINSKIQSAAQVACQTPPFSIPWLSVGTPGTAEFLTHDFTDALDWPDRTDIHRYGPIDIQERREQAMRQNVIREMSVYDSALVLVGEAHLHSMFTKLSREFNVRAYGFYPPPARSV
jgi:hypothetical protein